MAAVSDATQELVNNLDLTDIEENPATVSKITPLDENRRKIYAEASPDIPELQIGSGSDVLAVTCESTSGVLEHIVVVTDSTAKPIIITDKIMYDDVPICALIEYRFGENNRWLLSNISQSSLEMYRSSKFQQWRDLLLDGGGKCKATFKRMLKTGLVTNMYDHAAFPSPEDEKKDWQVKNDSGKIVDVPRPVEAIRVWDPTTNEYKALSARMDGAPPPGEEGTHWTELLVKLREKFGEDEVDPYLS
eukprot:m.26772 g.26772  ORF g.26772 m.26772 type:complete len:247 (+) comp7831_c0_seq1:387-1127(+)